MGKRGPQYGENGGVLPTESDQELMREALRLAAWCVPHGDVPVGAVVAAADGRIIGRGRNQREELGDPTAHAEVMAIRQAAAELGGWRLDGCTLVVTLEPCTMCAGAAIGARVARIVFGADEPKTGAVGSLWDVARDRRLLHQCEVVRGVLAAESVALLTEFFEERR